MIDGTVIIIALPMAGFGQSRSIILNFNCQPAVAAICRNVDDALPCWLLDAMGDGIFWSKQPQRGVRRPRLQIYGLKRVARHLGTHCGTYFLNIAIKDFRGEKGHRVLTHHAWLYASCHKPEGTEARPIIRFSIEKLTGIPIRNQRRYDRITVKVKKNIQVRKYPSGQLSPLLSTVNGKSKTWLVPKRLGNSYSCVAERGSRGMLKKVNAALKGSLNKGEAYLAKRFFTTPKSYIKCRNTAEHAMLLVARQNPKQGGNEWHLVNQNFSV